MVPTRIRLNAFRRSTIPQKQFIIIISSSSSSSSDLKGYVLKVDLEYAKELRELHNDYPLAPDKVETNREMFSDHHLKTADLIKSLLTMLKNQSLIFLTKKNMWVIIKTCNFTWDTFKAQNNVSYIRIESTSIAKKYVEFNTKRR